jgi:multidrug efflux pump subunit AcrA (membrane-fusion protein)
MSEPGRRRAEFALPGRFAFLVSRKAPGLSLCFVSLSFAAFIGICGLVVLGRIEETVKAPCMLRSADAPSELRTAVAGWVSRYAVSDGDEVRAGQVVLLLDADKLGIELDRTRERRASLEGRERDLREYRDAIAADPPGAIPRAGDFAARLAALRSTLDALAIKSERVSVELADEE